MKKIIGLCILILTVGSALFYLSGLGSKNQRAQKKNYKFRPRHEKAVITNNTAQMHVMGPAVSVVVPVLDEDALRDQLKREVKANQDFLKECEKSVDDIFSQVLERDEKDFYSNSDLIRQSMRRLSALQIHSQSLKNIFNLIEKNAQVMNDEWLVEMSMDLRPCRPFVRMEFMNRLSEGLLEKKFSQGLAQEVRRFVISEIERNLNAEGRMFSIGLYSGLLHKLSSRGIIPVSFKSELTGLEGRVKEYAHKLQLEVEKAPDEGGQHEATRWFTDDLKEANAIKGELLDIIEQVKVSSN